MQTINIAYIIGALILTAGFVSILKYIVVEKKTEKVSYAELLIKMIKSFQYKKEVLDNDYPEYHGELEQKDTNEFIDFLDMGILCKFDSKRSE